VYHSIEKERGVLPPETCPQRGEGKLWKEEAQGKNTLFAGRGRLNRGGGKGAIVGLLLRLREGRKKRQRGPKSNEASRWGDGLSERSSGKNSIPRVQTWGARTLRESISLM